jgi:D-glycero-D-manno-heptose 1,7-bisphosphate phosphatase
VNKALFLDRDGVINVDHIDVHTKEHFDFMDGIFELCLAAQRLGYKIIVITNQSGVARGVYTETDVHATHEYMESEFLKQGVIITDVYVCMSHNDSDMCRKPNPGMLLQAQKDHSIDMTKSVMVGDKERDVLAGKRAGCGRTILLASGGTAQGVSTEADVVAGSLEEVVRLLAKGDRGGAIS